MQQYSSICGFANTVEALKNFIDDTPREGNLKYPVLQGRELRCLVPLARTCGVDWSVSLKMTGVLGCFIICLFHKLFSNEQIQNIPARADSLHIFFLSAMIYSLSLETTEFSLCIDPMFIVRASSRGPVTGKQHEGPVIIRFLACYIFPFFPCPCFSLSFLTAFCAVSHHLISPPVLYALSLGRRAASDPDSTDKVPMDPVSVQCRSQPGSRWHACFGTPSPFVNRSAGLPRFLSFDVAPGRLAVWYRLGT
ncbi:uncharacterized protein BO80DRAFT_143534 [Aspergillus ibericus CBS 121593]|uniref:Uncharacterized protein n=1 Tax=Aspergillus ibericus CBS 121593 TaxID=1448316 RepID=A0A395GUE7_9EURO|nr:hypothetical protein BO80DRAFT_143534 [Aspergillus ibericus CBS 121593]RAK99042.1 hypothetical protein BO80DRAFT_143534 [Aspergillus ibericus CBS 121593]